ncbi:type VI secretion system protein ImpK [Pseudomonas delhiensis]|uniref:Type VI secretion system protein ImpK n=1 Tax=Pseudomonas delhiensis TaxID=366289 RepID=A0A239IA68_9PSED|nr:DotU family type VI secretion system protein [Pseudomonas delhiensis]SDK16034.1 type VI secretion system protein ImpK [Pseudomonas delhiensis]SNS90431.1 type VI secretion system protein ImpK [Pseudomonas delhiensis]
MEESAKAARQVGMDRRAGERLPLRARNPLVEAATPLLNAIPQLRHAPLHADPAALRHQLIEQVRRFEVNGQKAGLGHEVLIGARYCLCTVLDEAISLTPWGQACVWSRNGLLVTFHNETWGGEKFFQLLARLSQNPRENLPLLELLNLCLLFGFEGRYRVLDGGRSHLETLRQRLQQVIRTSRGAYSGALSAHALDTPVGSRTWRPMLPLWACAALFGLCACLTYINLNWRLGDATEPVLSAIYQVQLPRVELEMPAARPLEPRISLKRFFHKEIAEGLVTVRDDEHQSVVIMRGDGLFASGASSMQPAYLPLVRRVAQVLGELEGKVLVLGYTDSDPIRSARFASNWELSQARAESVGRLLLDSAALAGRIQAEGRGEREPLAPNDSRANKALNRRVEIALQVPPRRPAHPWRGPLTEAH